MPYIPIAKARGFTAGFGKQFVVNPAGRMEEEAQKRGFTILKWHAAV